MEKIVIHKNETAAEIIEKIFASEEQDIMLVIPKNAGIRDSISNFHLLRRKTALAEKNVSIESVDEEILALAKAAKLEAIHPLFSFSKGGKSLSDIVPLVKELKNSVIIKKNQKKSSPEVALEIPDKEEHFVADRIRWQGKLKPFVIAGVIILLLISSVLIVNAFWSKATIVVNLKKTPWNFEGNIRVSPAVSTIDAQNSIIPGQLFREEKSVAQFFPASGKATVSKKATGNITIYNAYSSELQTLVASTRFTTSDGKIFRLETRVLVPGAQIKNGKVIPASVKALVTADQAGEAYNLSRADKLTIPGFKGTPKYDAFYGALESGALGGFVGEKPVPADADIALAKDRTTEILRTAFQGVFLKTKPDNLTILPTASAFQVTKLAVNSETDEKGNFSILGAAQFQALGFAESDIKSLLRAKAGLADSGKDFFTLAIDSKNAHPDFEKKELAINVSADGEIATALEAENFKHSLLGKSEGEARTLIAGINDLSDAKISLWPFWMRHIPKDVSRVNLIVR